LNKNVTSLEINVEGSLLSAEAASLWEKLENLLDELDTAPANKQHGVFLILAGSHSDFSESFLNELRTELLLDDFYLRIRKTQEIVTRIFQSRHLWVFGFDGDCYGSYFDLALACDYRFCFHPLAQCGFHEISAQGLFPTLGGFRYRMSQNPRSRKEWQKTSVFHAKEAVALGLIEAVDYSTTWKQDISRWITEKITDYTPETPADIEQKKSTSNNNIEKLITEPAFKKISDVLDHERDPHADEQSHIFEYGWKYLTGDSKHFTTDNAFAVLTYFCARRMLNSYFLSWWARRGKLLGSLVKYTPSKVLAIYIDLNNLIPPVQALVRLIDSGYVIYFYAHRAIELREGLDLIFTRFERNYPKDKIDSYWSKGVCWFVGDVNESSQPNPIMKWYPDDKLTVSTQGENLSFLRFEGNRSGSLCGWAEFSVAEFAPETTSLGPYKVVRVMSDGIIQTKQLSNAHMDLSTFVRSLLLDELINISVISTKDILRTLTLLKEEGWRYIAEENSWEYFLRSRDESYDDSTIGTRIGSLEVSEKCWQLGVWREVKQLVKLRSTQEPHNSDNPHILLSQHLCYFAALIVNIIEQEQFVQNQTEADIFISEVIGFPKQLGTPLAFVKNQGRSRFNHYINQHWPDSTLLTEG